MKKEGLMVKSHKCSHQIVPGIINVRTWLMHRWELIKEHFIVNKE